MIIAGAEYVTSGWDYAQYIFLCFDKRFAGIPVLKKTLKFGSTRTGTKYVWEKMRIMKETNWTAGWHKPERYFEDIGKEHRWTSEFPASTILLFSNLFRQKKL